MGAQKCTNICLVVAYVSVPVCVHLRIHETGFFSAAEYGSSGAAAQLYVIEGESRSEVCLSW